MRGRPSVRTTGRLLVVAVLLGPLLALAQAPAQAATSCLVCNPDPRSTPSSDGEQEFSGSITLVQGGGPGHGGSVTTRGGDCPGCRWRLVLLCPTRNLNAPGNQGNDVNCLGATSYCDDRGGGEAYVLGLLRPPSMVYQQVDIVCIGGSNGVIATPDLPALAEEAFARAPLPDSPLVVQPPGGALINVPAIFHGSEPTADTASASVGGGLLTLTIEPYVVEHRWDFGDATTRTTQRIGDAYRPGVQVPREGSGEPFTTHTYAEPRTATVRLTTVWAARFTVTGAGGAVTQVPGTREVTTTATLPVKTARSELVSR